jgi:hypothetical protein
MLRQRVELFAGERGLKNRKGRYVGRGGEGGGAGPLRKPNTKTKCRGIENIHTFMDRDEDGRP